MSSQRDNTSTYRPDVDDDDAAAAAAAADDDDILKLYQENIR
jgi:hypothetical protein